MTEEGGKVGRRVGRKVGRRIGRKLRRKVGRKEGKIFRILPYLSKKSSTITKSKLLYKMDQDVLCIQYKHIYKFLIDNYWMSEK